MTIKNTFMASNIDPQKVADIIRQCAAIYIVPRFRALQSHEINAKSGPNDLVTIADIETERALDEILTREFPGSILIGEEGISSGAKSLSLLQNRTGIIWVVDPVDGTNNFAKGLPDYCVMLACVVDGVTRMSWIYDVQTGRMMIAEKGKGVHIDGVRQTTAVVKPLGDCAGFGGRKYFRPELHPHFDRVSSSVRNLDTLNCAGHEYLRIITGASDFSLYNKINPWDHLAGALAVEEAGGSVMKWDGSAYTPQDTKGGLIVAANATLAQQLRQNFIQDMVNEYNRKRGPQ